MRRDDLLLIYEEAQPVKLKQDVPFNFLFQNSLDIRPDGFDLALRIAKLISNDFLLWARKDKRRPISIEEALISNRFKC